MDVSELIDLMADSVIRVTVATRGGSGFAGVVSVVTDAHGTPVATVQNTDWAAQVSRIRTDPFGAARAGEVGEVAGRGFLGAPTDAGGLSLLGARFYDPGTGTFLSVDPELAPGNPAQFNAYVYAGNNPLTWADPTGRNWFGDAWKNVTGWVDKHKAEIRGVLAGAVVTTGCLIITAGAGSLACLVAGSATAAAVTNVQRQVDSGKPFDVANLIYETALGGTVALVGGYAFNAAAPTLAAAASRVVAMIKSTFVKPGPNVLAPGVRPNGPRPMSSELGSGATNKVPTDRSPGLETRPPLTEREIGSAMDDILWDADFVKQANVTQYSKPGGIDQANADFDRLTRGLIPVVRGNGLRTATLSNGTKINVRPFSSQGDPTLGIETPGNPGLKIRYEE